jgi:diguanylate cyclase (GGDEF)-like protein
MKLKYIASPDNKNIFAFSILFFLMIPAVGMVDYLTGPTITFALVYLIPVAAFVGLNVRLTTTVLASILTAVTWIVVDHFSDRFSLNIIVYSWNFFSRLSILLIVSITLSFLKKSLLDAHNLSRRDPLTNALNVRGFKELADREVYRSTRSGNALTIAFLDVDDFKSINDTLGHSAGDKFLAAIVETLLLNLRHGDLVGRMGGDEFAIPFPDTGQDAAKIIVAKTRTVLMENTAKLNFPVTFSIGVLTCVQPLASVDAMIEMADKLMYKVKAGSKNDVIFSQYPDSP